MPKKIIFHEHPGIHFQEFISIQEFFGNKFTITHYCTLQENGTLEAIYLLRCPFIELPRKNISNKSRISKKSQNIEESI